jgi:parallel beta-helix repeat protein
MVERTSEIKNARFLVFVLSFMILLAILSIPVTAATLNVSTVVSPLNFTTIQAAINSASSGDTILVYAGTYPEAITVNRTLLTIEGTSGIPVLGNANDDASVQISATGVILENLKITTGSRWDVNISDNNLTLESLDMTGHNPVDPNDPVITGDGLDGITIQGCQLGSSGKNGIELNDTANITLRDSMMENSLDIDAFFNNTATLYSNINIVNNTFQGGAINIYSPKKGLITYPEIRNILVDNNTITASTSGGIDVSEFEDNPGTFHMFNVTVTHNSLSGSQTNLGNIYLDAISGGVVKDNVVTGSNKGGDGIDLADLNEFTIEGNSVEDSTGSQQFQTMGLSLIMITNSVVSHNILTNVQPFSFYYAPGPVFLPNLTFDTTNTADGSPVLYYEGATGITINGQQPAMVVLMSCSNMNLISSTIKNSGVGMGIYNSTGTTVSGTSFQDDNTGMMLIQSADSTIEGNTFTGPFMGLGVGDNTNTLISGNTFTGYLDSGIVLHTGRPDNVSITGNTFTGTWSGNDQAIVTSEVNGTSITIAHNTLNQTTRGFLVYFTTSLTLQNNIITDSGIGINLNAAQNNVFINNTILNGEGEYMGVYMYNNLSLGGGPCVNNSFSNNYIQSDIPISVDYGGTDPNIAMDFGPIWGPGIQEVNILPPADEPITGNIWNVTKAAGTNIVNGPFIGGNYWATAGGSGWSQITPDRGDGFCNAPFIYDANNTDFLPLHTVISPTPTPTPVPHAHSAGTCYWCSGSGSSGSGSGYTSTSSTPAPANPTPMPTMQQTVNVPVTVPATPSPVYTEPPLPTNTPKSGIDAVPVICALGLCGVIFLFRKNEN